MKATSISLLIKNNFPQVFMFGFLVAMFSLAAFIDISPVQLFNDSMIRLVMNGVLVLSLVPMLNTGVGINYGLPVGIVAGLLGLCLAVNFYLKGLAGFFIAVLLVIPIAVVFGQAYARLLNWAKGKEEIAGIFIGFSFVFIMNFFWATAPFTNPQMLWPIGGQGLRPTIGLKNFFGKALTDLWVLEIGDLRLPLGLLAFFGLLCLLLYLFFKTKTGRAMLAVGENESFAQLSGINIERMRTLAIVLSTVIGAIGICVYAQSYGFIELYEAPLMMAFPAASAILIGGSKGGRTLIIHVILGTYLFQTILILSTPIANTLIVPEASELLRIIIANGIILYALLYGGSRARIEKS